MRGKKISRFLSFLLALVVVCQTIPLSSVSAQNSTDIYYSPTSATARRTAVNNIELSYIFDVYDAQVLGDTLITEGLKLTMNFAPASKVTETINVAVWGEVLVENWTVKSVSPSELTSTDLDGRSVTWNMPEVPITLHVATSQDQRINGHVILITGGNPVLTEHDLTSPLRSLQTFVSALSRRFDVGDYFASFGGSELTPSRIKEAVICLEDKGRLENLKIHDYDPNKPEVPPYIVIPVGVEGCPNTPQGSALMVAYGMWIGGVWKATLLGSIETFFGNVATLGTTALFDSISEVSEDRANNIIFFFRGFEPYSALVFGCDIQGDCAVFDGSADPAVKFAGSFTSDGISIDDTGHLKLLINRVIRPWDGSGCPKPLPHPETAEPQYNMDLLHDRPFEVKDCVYTESDGWLALWGVGDISSHSDECGINNLFTAGGLGEATKRLTECLVSVILTPMIQWATNLVQTAAGISRTPQMILRYEAAIRPEAQGVTRYG